MKWRFKTKEEFIAEGLWNVFNDEEFPTGFNRNGAMNYLIGKEIEEKYHSYCENNSTFKYDGKWTISKHSYKKVVINEFGGLSSIPKLHVPNQDTIQSQELPQFNLSKLAGEIDELFEKKLEQVVTIQSELGNAFVAATEDKLQTYKDDVNKIFKDIKESLLDEVRRGHTTLVLGDSRLEINIQDTDHPKMIDVIKSLHQQKKAMLVGPAGTGKTYMISEISKRLNLPFYKYSCSRDSSVHDLLGYKQPKSETYLETVFLNAYENGGIFLVDEYDAMSGDMSLFFNGIADSSKFISVPHRDSKPIAEKHKDFYLVMCGNTWGKGSIDYSGRDFQDMALMDRFRFCRHFIGYHLTLEKKWMGVNYQFALDLRQSLEEVGSYLSTRNIEDIANLLSSGANRKTIISMVTEDIDDEGKKAINKKLERY